MDKNKIKARRPVHKRWSTWLIVIVVIMIVGNMGNDEEVAVHHDVGTPPVTSSTTEEEPEVADVSAVITPLYSVVSREDVSVRDAIRLQIFVVPDDVFALEDGDIKAVAVDVIANEKRTGDFNAVTVFIIDNEREAGRGLYMARAIYAPDGDFAKAVEVKSGDYRKHTFNYDIKKLPRDNENYPTEAEINIYYDVMEALWADEHVEESAVLEKVAEDNEMSVEGVNAAVNKSMVRFY